MQSKLYIFILLFSIIISAGAGHPGGLDKDGGHTCRTNCEDWGLEYGQYHYHTPTATSSPTTLPTITATPTQSKTPVPSPTPAPVSMDREARVVYVVDGDTIKIDNQEIIRLVGINTPEMNEQGGKEAKQYVTDRLLNKQIYLDVDDKKTKDKYGRTLAVVYINGENLNRELLCLGYAEVMYIPPSEFTPYGWRDSCGTNSSELAHTNITEIKKQISKLESRLDNAEKDIKEQHGRIAWLEEKVNAILKWIRWV